MAKPKTTSIGISKGTSLEVTVAGQNGSAVCTAGALEGGDFTNWSPKMLEKGVTYKPGGSCALEFLVDFLDTSASALTITVERGEKQPKKWTVEGKDGALQTWQLWVLVD